MTRRMAWLPLSLVACLAAATLVPSTARAREVYLNGVKLDGNVVLKNQTFPACEVKFDEQGNVYITAKGFKIQLTQVDDAKDAKDAKDKVDAPAPPVTPPVDGKLTKRYWLVSRQAKRGAAQYDIDVFVNDTFVKKVRSADDAVVLEVTKHVRPGTNKVRLIAQKSAGDKRASSSPVDTLEVVLGEGNVGGGTVTIDKPVVSYSRNASETQAFKDELTFTGR